LNKASKAGSRILQGAKEALAIARGEADRSTYRVHVPAEVNVKSIRRRLKLTQDEFSRRFAIPQGTLRDWEQGRRHPEGPARTLLLVIAHEPQAVERALAHSMIFDRGTASTAGASPVERVSVRSNHVRSAARSPSRKRGESGDRASAAPSVPGKAGARSPRISEGE
jgi:putative transcriptional regulator